MPKCQYCGKECKDNRGRAAHERNFCPNRPGGEDKTKKKQGEACNHAYRFLNPRVEVEAAAMQAGFSEVCTKCEELSK